VQQAVRRYLPLDRRLTVITAPKASEPGAGGAAQ